MKRITRLIAIAFLSTSSAWAQHSSKEIQEDIERHKQMAAAHGAAAQCLQSGRKPDDCNKELQTACKGLALGKFCGIRHAH